MADCDSIEGLLSSLSNQVAALNQKVADLEAKKADKNRVESLSRDVAKLFGEIAGILTQVNQIVETAVKPIREAVAYILGMIDRFLTKPELSDLERKVNNLAIELSGTTALARGASNGVISLRSKVQGIEKDIIWLRNQLTEVIKELTRQINIVKRKIDIEIDGINKKLIALSIAVFAAIAAATKLLLAAIAALSKKVFAALAAINMQIRLIWAFLRSLRLRNGRDGRDGINGRNGINGKDGAPGPQGPPGPPGKSGGGGGGGGSGNGARGPAGKDGKNGKNGKDGKDAKVEFTTINVKVFDSCNSDGSAKFGSKSVKVIKGTESQESAKFEQIAEVRAQECKAKSAIAILPEHHQIKTGGNIPQLAILWREVKTDGSMGHKFRASTIPHYVGTRKPVLSNYKKGSCYARIILRDNSKIIVYADTQRIAETIAREQLNYVDERLKPSPVKVSLGERKGESLETITVKAVRISYFPNGQKNTQPEWVSEL